MLKEIAGYKGYFVSSLGFVIGKTGHALKESKAGRGYPTVALSRDGIVKTFYVHRLVAGHFIFNGLNKKTVNHVDGDKENNHVSNLEWMSYSENNQHAIDKGLMGSGEKHYRSKLTEEKVRELKESYDSSKTFQYYGDIYGVSKATIRDVVVGKTWKHV